MSLNKDIFYLNLALAFVFSFFELSPDIAYFFA